MSMRPFGKMFARYMLRSSWYDEKGAFKKSSTVTGVTRYDRHIMGNAIHQHPEVASATDHNLTVLEVLR